ncbi:MAG: nitroreductase family deazaflavin-dependent oxidoreductase [Chloroflexi bacterium]|nr:nitroreductase family deazaflavin-dependent oxidoreductase [Chloroflexota bacterium]
MAYRSGWRGWWWRLIGKFPMLPRPHTWIYRLTGGFIGSRLPFIKLRVLLLTTTGRRTGKPRTTSVLYFHTGEQLLIIASNRGAGRYPSWYWNLQYNPEVMIQIGRTRKSVMAKEASPEERRFLWPLLVEALPLFEIYQEKTPRELPVIVLHSAPTSRAGQEP